MLNDGNKKPEPCAYVLGVPVHGFLLQEFVDLAKSSITARKKILFTTLNTYSLLVAQDKVEFFNHFQEAEVILPDGIGIVVAARLKGGKCPERVSGPDFSNALLNEAELNGFSVYFLGGAENVIAQLKTNLTQRFPKLKIVGAFAPPFTPLEEWNNDVIIANINKVHPDILLVGMTAPKQELWLSRNYNKLDVRVMLGVGAAFDYWAGTKPQCPHWVGQWGLEWLYRLITSPQHMYRRHLVSFRYIYIALKKKCLSKDH